MTSQKIVPFLAELGLLLNLIRSISSAMNEESGVHLVGEDRFDNVRYIRNNPVSRLVDGFKQLESEVAYFFTDNGIRKATDKTFESQAIRQKFIVAFKTLSHEYFSLKSSRKQKNIFQQNASVNIEAGVYKLTRQHPAVVN